MRIGHMFSRICTYVARFELQIQPYGLEAKMKWTDISYLTSFLPVCAWLRVKVISSRHAHTAALTVCTCTNTLQYQWFLYFDNLWRKYGFEDRKLTQCTEAREFKVQSHILRKGTISKCKGSYFEYNRITKELERKKKSVAQEQFIAVHIVTDLSGEGHRAIKPGHKLFKKLGSTHSCLATLNSIDMLPFECMGRNLYWGHQQSIYFHKEWIPMIDATFKDTDCFILIGRKIEKLDWKKQKIWNLF